MWEGIQGTLQRFPAVARRHRALQRDPARRQFLHQLERDGFSLRYLSYEGDIAATDPATIVVNPQEHWMLWVQK